MKKKTAYILGTVFLVLTVIFACLTKFLDIAEFTVKGGNNEITEIGFSKINIYFHNLTGVHLNWYDITDKMGIIAIGFGLIFGAVGLYELINRKSLLKLDRYIYCLGGTYALLGIIYVLFEKIALNYRPIVMEGELSPEASFPSSHTLLICVILITAVIQINRLFKNTALKVILSIFGIGFALVAVFGRIYSGVHWFTDIVASLILTASIVFFYIGLSKENNGKHIKKNA